LQRSLQACKPRRNVFRGSLQGCKPHRNVLRAALSGCKRETASRARR
jgi:hypothetical protein